MKTRSYNQFCALAFALDAVGERWTLLIIRELLTGPRRFKDLVDGMPGISTNLLAERLKHLEQLGLLCRRVLPPPAGSTVYELTPMGKSLEKAVLELGRWGSLLLPGQLDDLSMPSIGTTALSIKAFFHPEQAMGINEVFELHIGNEILQVLIREGELITRQGQSLNPDVIIYTGMHTWMAVFSRQLDPDKAVSQGLIRVEGDPAGLRRFLTISGVPA